MLTTVDNPYNTFTQYDEWFQYDARMGYNTQNYLGRVVVSSSDISEDDQDLAIEQGIDEILENNPLYKKVVRSDATPPM